MKDVVIINQSSGRLTYDIIKSLKNRNFNVSLICSKSKNIFDDSIKHYYISSYNRKSIIKRMISWIKGYKEIVKILKRLLTDNQKIIFFTNPPFSYFAAKKIKNPYSIVIFDLYPDALNNINCPSFIKKYWRKNNIDIFNRADKIFAISEGMKNELLKYCPENKIYVVHLWPHLDSPVIVPKNKNELIINNNLENKFIILYSGNMGITHNLEPIIEVANILKNESEIVFIMIGDGGKKQKLISKTKELNLSNVIFMDYLPADKLKYTLSAASLGIVSVSKETANISVPSKTFNLLAYCIPILGIAPFQSEISRMILKYNCGNVFDGNDPYLISSWILKCKDNKLFYSDLKDKTGMMLKDFTIENANLIE